MVRCARNLAAVSLLGLAASACFFVAATGPTPTIAPVGIATPTPSPSATPTATPSPTPADPCKPPVTGVNLSGATSVPIGETFFIYVTPVNASGPLEGALDYCNNGRVPIVQSMSDNLRCVGACSGYKPTFLAQGVGPFEVRIRVDSASEVFAGTVTR